ncbi:MAG: filamentous hemagglutinin N-terminal domain-containing protein [Phormidium sp. BM_Day4_Bin.17]|nr:filamentous hemagglutinin N-terminal domain-containing protein [Phormidium sp. BM_Day4_Bin.17]UCJ13636.1 MAG: filamentous hemagglutinin N-terminal domain-containing protein [Phormidium sp. PBR-2020]
MNHWRSAIWGLPVAVIVCPSPTLAQIVPDSTLPIPSSVTVEDSQFTIEGGTQVDRNLFHSFEEFSLPTGNEAWFRHDLSIENILTRVTGEGISNIDGLIGADGVNLFLLNPNGIVFGPQAQLDIGGSFLATTAERFEFADGTTFGETPTSPNLPLLTVTTPVGLQFGANPGRIEVRGSGHRFAPDRQTGQLQRSPAGGLQVESGQSLTLLSGDISLNGGNLTAEQGNIHLGSVGGNSQVSLDNLFRPNYSGVEDFGSLDLRQRASVDVSGPGGGTIDLRSQRLSIQEGSTILSLTEGNQPGGSINVNVRDTIELAGLNLAPSSILTQTQGLGASGDVNIAAGQLSIRDGAQISSASFSPGFGGNLNLNIINELELIGTGPNGFPPSFLASTTGGLAPGGDLNVNAERVIISDGAIITADTFSRDFPGGNLSFDVGQLRVLRGGQVSASTIGPGDAGNISIRASDLVEVSGGIGEDSSGIVSQVDRLRSPTGGEAILATGTGGNINIQTPRLRILEGGQISAATAGGGPGGRINLNTELLDVQGSRNTPEGMIALSAVTAVTLGESNAGDLTVNSQQIRVQDGGQITAGTRGPGDAGDVTITADDIDLSGRTPDGRPSRFTVRTEGPGESGNLRIFGNRLTVREGAEINVNGILRDRDGTPILNLPLGSAGNLTIQVRDLFLNTGRLTAETTSGDFGNIIINANDIRLLENSQVTTNAVGTATGGNIEIDTDILTALENSNINANAQDNFGGRVILNTQGLFGAEFREESTPNSDITATSELGPDFSGIVEINTPEVDPVSALVELEDRPVNAAVDQNPCIQGSETELVVTGGGGLPPSANDPFSGTGPWQDLRLDPLDDPQSHDNLPEESPQARPSSPQRIRQAQDWTLNAEGELVLTAPDGGSNYRPPTSPQNCSPQSQLPQSDKQNRPQSQQSQEFQVQNFHFVGNTVFSDEELAARTQTLLNRPLSFEELQTAADNITEHYKEKGYITTGAYIPPQTTQNRVVTVQILEGTLEDIRVRTSGNLNPNYVVRRIERVAEGPVNQDQLIEALQLLQLDPHIDRLSAELAAGVQPGTNLLNVRVEERNAVTASLGLDNDRSPTVGSFRQQANSGIANLFGIGDVASLAYSNTEGTGNWNLGYQLPINALDGTVSLLYSTGESRIVEAPFDQVDIQADTRTYEVSYRQPLLRRVQPRRDEENASTARDEGQNSSPPSDYVFREFALGLTASRRDTQTSILDRNFPLSPGADNQGETNISVLRFFQDWTQRDSREVLALRSEFSLGVNWFGATVNDDDPDSQFFSWQGQAQWVRRLGGGLETQQPETRLVLRGNAQLSADSLVPIEQFSLGGRRRMRGYRQDVLLADSGLFASAEVQIPLFRFARRQGTVWLAPFVEAGTVWNLGDRPNPDTSSLASAGLGLRLQLGDRLSAAFDWGIPLVELDTGNDSLQDNGLYFSIRFNPL